MSHGGPLQVSRYKIELFTDCPRCFYREVVHGVARPRSKALRLNNAVDFLLKREFDAYRRAGAPHPLMIQSKVNAVPLDDPRLGVWRDYPGDGLRAVHGPTNIEVCGFVDDIWVAADGGLIVVDYKATAPKPNERRWPPKVWDAWRHQVFVYQWLLRANGLRVEDLAYFVHAEGDIDAAGLDSSLRFELSLLSCDCSGERLEPTLYAIREVLSDKTSPEAGPGFDGKGCEWCSFLSRADEADEGRSSQL